MDVRYFAFQNDRQVRRELAIIREFQKDRQLTPAEASSLQNAIMDRNPCRIPVRHCPSRRSEP